MTKELDKLLKQLLNLHPKYIDLSLDRLTLLLNKLENPHLRLPPVIHIAGTNGKGSILSYIFNILKENHYIVHSYISPHLNRFNERMVISNKEIKTDKLIKTLKYVKKINQKKPITFFEITTAAAFYLFSKEKADFLILETGLGGRLDATNVISKSLIDIISPIGIDHQEFLGKNIYKITNEKLGIIKKKSNVIISNQKKIVKSYIKKKLLNNKNNILYYNSDFKISTKEKKFFNLKYKNKNIEFKKPNLIGEHQIENASAAIAAVLCLKENGYKILNSKINKGIIKTKWPGRLEKGKLKNITVFLDGAHNIDGADIILKYFQSKKTKVWLIIGMLNNKNIYDFLKKIKPILHGVIGVPIPNEKNTTHPGEIIKICNKLNILSFQKFSIFSANNFILQNIKPKVILISGSLYLIGKVRKHYL